MGRRATGWQLKEHASGLLYVRFRHGGRRYDLSTGTRDPREAREVAAARYAEVVSGRSAPRASGDLAAALAEWLAAYEADHAPGTARTVEMYATAHWLPFFQTAARLTPASLGDYARARLREVTRSTVRKEMSGLRRFLGWWAERGGPAVTVPGLPAHGFPGKRSKVARKEKARILSQGEVAKLLANLPLRNRRRAWVRPLFVVLWETGLRPSTVFKLEARHFNGRELHITKDIDKAHADRVLPLTKAAREALRCLPFPRVALRSALRYAAEKAGLGPVSVYDLRHSRMTLWANSGAPLPGVQYLAGHRHLSTTARYVQAQRKAADKVLAAANR